MNKGVQADRRRGTGLRVFLRRAVRRISRSRRRGVVSVVSMMFLILFGSLAAAMAIMSRGNIVTAATHQQVTRALGAAETGLAIAEIRLLEACRRFSVAKGEIDEDFGWAIWSGIGWPGNEPEVVNDPTSYPNGAGAGTPSCVADALAQAHGEDALTIEIPGEGTPALPTIAANEEADPLVYKTQFWLYTPAVVLDQSPGGAVTSAFYVQYAPLANGTDVRIIVTGYDLGYGGIRAKPVERRITQDYRIIKRVEAAIVSPSRIMIGKNVLVEGDLGAVYQELDSEYSDPLVMRSDFYGIDTQLNNDLDLLFDGLLSHDLNNDNRLRVGHPVEILGIPDLDGNGSPDGSALDLTQDGYVDEFDLFIRRYDTNEDGMVALSDTLRAGTPNQSGVSAEFSSVDEELAWLIDSQRADRNDNGVSSYDDANDNGRYEPGEGDTLDDVEILLSPLPPSLQNYGHGTPPNVEIWRDELLGFRDGVIDRRDQYAKVVGKLNFRVGSQEWIEAQGDYMERIRGPIHPDAGQSAMSFEVGVGELPEIDVNSFNQAENTLRQAADGDPFWEQVAQNLGVPVSQLATWDANLNPAGAGPKLFQMYPDTDLDGRPDNWNALDPNTARFEKAPFNSPNFADWYYRPTFENMTFKNVQIPQGTNGLFIGCTFVGVTYIRSFHTNNHPNWTIYGKMKTDPAPGSAPAPDPPRTIYGDVPGENSYPSMLPTAATPAGTPPQMILMAVTPMDKADIPQNQVPLTIGYNDLPGPLVIGPPGEERRYVDTKRLSNNCRFHSCLFVGSIVSDAPQSYTHVRNKLQFTGATRFVSEHPTEPGNPLLNPDPGDLEEIAKSSLMCPNYSIDIGSFNSPPEQDVRLHGAIVAGVLDIRGNASIDGVLLTTFAPKMGEGPLQDPSGVAAGNPALFNTTLGYFGPEDGDEESLDPLTLPTMTINGQLTKIVGFDVPPFDGLPDVGPQGPQPPGSLPVQFWGYGGINLRFDKDLVLPDGLIIPLRIDAKRITYRETSK